MLINKANGQTKYNFVLLLLHLSDACRNYDSSIKKLNQQVASLTEEINNLKSKSLPWPYNGYTYSLTFVPMTWEAARKECQESGGDLAVHGIRDIITRLSIGSAKELKTAWVGLSDIEDEGVWEWVTGEQATLKEVRWVAKQPDNNRNEDCGEMWSGYYDYRINDASCSKENYGLCEKRYNTS